MIIFSIIFQEDYMDDECQSTGKLSSNNPEPSLPTNTQVNRQISQVSSTSDSHIPSSNIVDELVSALNHLTNTQPLPSVLPVNKPVEPPPVIPQTTVNHPIQIPISTTNVPLRSSNKSFSNRLGMMMPSNQTQNSVVQESKPIPSAHQYLPPKSKSPVIVKQRTISPLVHKNQNEISPSAISKCKFFF
jgi:hypothetical protein